MNGVTQTFVPGKNLAGIDISTQQGAEDAIEVLNAALDTVTRQRAKLGAIVNRMRSSIDALVNASTNTKIAKGRIENADFAAEMAKLVKLQILTEAASQVLSRANSSGQNYVARLIQ